MENVKNYYQILDVPTNASVQLIKRAIRDLRKQDRSSKFSIIINNIEQVLTDCDQRRLYDSSINLSPKECINYDIMHEFIPLKDQGIIRESSREIAFFDLAQQSEEKKRAQLEKDEALKNLRFSPYSKTKTDVLIENNSLKFSHSFTKKQWFLFTLLFLSIFAGVVSFKPLRERYIAYTQVKVVMDKLKIVSAEIESFIRKNKYFPENLPELHIQANSDNFYNLILSNERQIVASFNENASKFLQGNYINYNSSMIPNLGLTWVCSSSVNFPETYLPANCKIHN